MKPKTPKEYNGTDFIFDCLGGVLLFVLAIVIYILL